MKFITQYIEKYEWDNLFDLSCWIMMIGCIVYTFTLFQSSSTNASLMVTNTASHTVQSEAIANTSAAVHPEEVEKALKKADEILKANDYTNVIKMMEDIIKKYPRESYPYVYLARALEARNNIWEAIHNYATGVKLNPDFVDKSSSHKIGPELKEIVKRALILQEKSQDDPVVKKYVKNLYYLQRRLSGGCE